MKHEIILDDFAKRDEEFISELVYDALNPVRRAGC